MSIQALVERTKNFIRQRQVAYQTTFAGPVGEQVLADLAKFCRAYTTTFHEDPRIAAMLDGRREVFLRISQNLHLSDEDLWKLVGRPDLEK